MKFGQKAQFLWFYVEIGKDTAPVLSNLRFQL